MADTTKDIWNDNEEEDEKRPLLRQRRFLFLLITLALVLGVVIVAAWRDGTGFDAIKRLTAYGGTEQTDRFLYDVSPSNRFAVLGDGLAVLSDTAFTVLDGGGEEIWSANVKMSAPALSAGGGNVVAYDVGGTELYVVNGEGERLHLTVDEEEALISATMNESGYLAVTSGKRNYKGCVSVYDPDMELVFAFNSSKRFVTDAYVTEDNDTVAAVTLGQEESVFVSNIVLYDLDETEPSGNYDVKNGLVLEITEKNGRITTVSDTCLTFASRNGTVTAEYDYHNEYLREYALTGDGFTSLLLNRYQSGSVGRLVNVRSNGEEIASRDVNAEVRDLSASGRYLAVLYMDRMVIYNQELEEYAVCEDTKNAKEIVMRPDGSVLLLSTDSAGIFLP